MANTKRISLPPGLSLAYAATVTFGLAPGEALPCSKRRSSDAKRTSETREPILFTAQALRYKNSK